MLATEQRDECDDTDASVLTPVVGDGRVLMSVRDWA